MNRPGNGLHADPESGRLCAMDDGSYGGLSPQADWVSMLWGCVARSPEGWASVVGALCKLKDGNVLCFCFGAVGLYVVQSSVESL